MSVFNLTYATTRAMISVLRRALVADPLFQPDKTGPSRTAESMVLDAWGYQVRDFPVVVVTGVPGANRRTGIGDQVRPFFGLGLKEEVGGTSVLRTFDIPLITVVGSTIDLRYTGANAGDMDTPGPWELEVKTKTVGPNVIHYVELAGNVVGPASTFPLANFEASTKHFPTGQIFGGWYDLNIEIVGCARSTQTRELLADRIWSLVWFLQKKALRKLGVVVLDVRHSGFAQIEYGSDKIYQTKFSVAVATEFEAIAQFTEAVEEVSVEGTAVSAMP